MRIGRDVFLFYKHKLFGWESYEEENKIIFAQCKPQKTRLKFIQINKSLFVIIAKCCRSTPPKKTGLRGPVPSVLRPLS